MPHVYRYRSEVKEWAKKGPLHSRAVRPRTPPLAHPEHDTYPLAAETPQYQAVHAQYQAAPADSHTNAADTYQNDTVEAPHNKHGSTPVDIVRVHRHRLGSTLL